MFRSVAFVLLVAAPLQAQVLEKLPQYPSKLGLDTKWDDSKAKGLTPAVVGGLLKDDIAGSYLIKWGDARYRSLWASVDRELVLNGSADAGKKLLSDLRTAQEPSAKALLRNDPDIDRAMSVLRRYPWAPSLQAALVSVGEAELRRGHEQLAARCFRDVLLRAADDDVRKRAQVGLWLVAAHDPDRAVLTAAFAGIDDAATFPWLGGKATAKSIRERLADTSPTAALSLKTLDKKILDFPSRSATPYDRPAAAPDGVAVAGPTDLSWFNGAKSKPTWSQDNPLSDAKESLAHLSPGPSIPSVSVGKVFTRWSNESVRVQVTLQPRVGAAPLVHASINLPVHVAAFDARTGVQLWSTESNPDWKELCAANDPVAVDGRLYLLATSRTHEYSPIYLACLSADSGSLLWKRELVTCNITSISDKRRIDLVHSGNPVTVAHGSVYCSTSAGLVACCDARDGAIEWVRTYPRDATGAAAHRPGSAPLVALASQRVVFTPRDAGFQFAINPSTGDFAWLKLEEGGALFALGTAKNVAVFSGSRRLVGLDLEKGKIAWERPFEQSIDGRATLHGGSIVAATAEKLFRVDPLSGKIEEQSDWTPPRLPQTLLVQGKTLYAVIPADARATKQSHLQRTVPSPGLEANDFPNVQLVESR